MTCSIYLDGTKQMYDNNEYIFSNIMSHYIATNEHSLGLGFRDLWKIARVNTSFYSSFKTLPDWKVILLNAARRDLSQYGLPLDVHGYNKGVIQLIQESEININNVLSFYEEVDKIILGHTNGIPIQMLVDDLVLTCEKFFKTSAITCTEVLNKNKRMSTIRLLMHLYDHVRSDDRYYINHDDVSIKNSLRIIVCTSILAYIYNWLPYICTPPDYKVIVDSIRKKTSVFIRMIEHNQLDIKHRHVRLLFDVAHKTCEYIDNYEMLTDRDIEDT